MTIQQAMMAIVPDPLMPAVLLVALIAAAVVMLVAFRHRSSYGRSARGALPAPSKLVVGRPDQPEPEDNHDGLVLALPTERPNEVFFLGRASELEQIGRPLAVAPPQLARHATKLAAGTGAARSYAELSGRLVLVDDKTAAALRSGKMMKDKAGEIMGHVVRDDGKVSSVTRIRKVSRAATGASLTNAMSAMAMQAQLDRIERQLSVISDGIDQANRELLREWHAQTLGAQDVLREVYGTASRTGELTASNWLQVSGIGHVVRTQVNGDRDRLAEAVARLEAQVRTRNVKRRIDALDSRLEAVMSAHAALTESTRAWAQYSALRLWYFNVTEDPTIEAYRHELQQLITSSCDELEPIRVRVMGALKEVEAHRWTARVRHPFVVRRLPAATAEGLAAINRIPWHPLELQPPASGDRGPAIAPHDET